MQTVFSKGCLLLYLIVAVIFAWKIISHTQASTHAIEEILIRFNMQNEGEQALEQYKKEHPFWGTLIASPVKDALALPSQSEAHHALNAEAAHLLKTVRLEASYAAWWSWGLINMSLLAALLMVIAEKTWMSRHLFFLLTLISLVFFGIGIFAPAMIIWTAPVIPLPTGNLNFVLQHEVRGIAAIIWELITSGHWIIGGFLLLFSIVTPLTKASLTLFLTASSNKKLNHQIARFLHSIGKWSMADVFVAGVLLALFALKSEQATKSIPCLGLYFFISYCLLSLSTTELLIHAPITHSNLPSDPLNHRLQALLITGTLVFMAASFAYTFDQYKYTPALNQYPLPNTPQQLNNVDLVLPAHK